MRKISTKNILKKIFKRKSEKKVKKTKKIIKPKTKKIIKPKTKKTKKLIIKKTKVVSKKKIFKIIKVKKIPKVVEKKSDTKIDNLRIARSNELKPEIKKVKKQDTEKREYKIKDYVVYPRHGVGSPHENAPDVQDLPMCFRERRRRQPSGERHYRRRDCAGRARDDGSTHHPSA